MNDVHGYEQALARYRRWWTLFAIATWIPVWLVELFLLVSWKWEVAVHFDMLSHVLLLLPIFAWIVGRRRLCGPVLAAEHVRPVAPGYRASARSPSEPIDHEAWLVTGAFPRWSLVLAGVYGLLDASLFAIAPLLYVAAWIALVFFIVARVLFFWVWFARVRRDASRVGVLELGSTGASEASREFLLRCLDGPLFVSLTMPDDDPNRLHLNVAGFEERWAVVRRVMTCAPTAPRLRDERAQTRGDSAQR